MKLNKPRNKISRNYNKEYSKIACKREVWLNEYFEEIEIEELDYYLIWTQLQNELQETR